uniref:Transposase n=1 Tax=Ascaris lumbricoides TaxID=6252 RepID=A0A0M3IPR0_ASCLU
MEAKQQSGGWYDVKSAMLVSRRGEANVSARKRHGRKKKKAPSDKQQRAGEQKLVQCGHRASYDASIAESYGKTYIASLATKIRLYERFRRDK